MSRDFNWLQAYAEYTAESESPDSFHLWTGLSVIASAVGRKIWLDQGIYTLFPNLYVILVGPPGRVAKSTSIRLGRTILLGVEDVVFGPDSVTREELIRQMGKVGGKDKNAEMTIHSTELSSLIEPSGVPMIQFLTDIYDGDFKWRYSTKGSGRDTLNNPLLNILAGTTPSWIAEGMPADVIGHGFTSRVIFVYEEVPRHLNPDPLPPDEKLVHALKQDLIQISTLKGQFVWDGEQGDKGEPGYVKGPAKEAYHQYYKDIAGTQPSDYRVEGYHWRKKVHLLKVAMLLSLAERDSLVIKAVDIHTAWELLGSIEDKMYKTFSAVGKYEHASDMERILQQIMESGGISRQEIFRRNRAAGSIDDLGKMLAMLRSMGSVKFLKKNGQDLVVPADQE